MRFGKEAVLKYVQTFISSQTTFRASVMLRYLSCWKIGAGAWPGRSRSPQVDAEWVLYRCSWAVSVTHGVYLVKASYKDILRSNKMESPTLQKSQYCEMRRQLREVYAMVRQRYSPSYSGLRLNECQSLRASAKPRPLHSTRHEPRDRRSVQTEMRDSRSTYCCNNPYIFLCCWR